MSNKSKARNRRKKQQQRKRGGGGGGKRQQSPTPTPAAAGNTVVAEKAEESEPESQSWGQWFGSWFADTGTTEATHEIEGDDLHMVDGLGSTETMDFGEGVKEDEPELPTPDVITVNLAKKDFERQFGAYDSKGSVSLDAVLSGYKGKAEFEVSNAREESREIGKVAFAGGRLAGEFTQETSMGEKYSAKGEGAWTAEEVSAKAELSAFMGYSDSTKAEFKIQVGGQTIATFSGSAGTSIGYGGKLKGEMTFKGGKVSWGAQSTASAGVGLALDYKIEVDGAAIADGMLSWAMSWGAWLWDAAGSLSEALTDEDGEPIML